MKRAFVIALAVTITACGDKSNNDTASASQQTSGADAPYAPQPMLGQSLPEIADAIRRRDVTSEELVHAYLKRIETVDWSGPSLQSVLAINPDALGDARALDQQLADGDIRGPLHGVPILLKDNIESRDPMATTAGALVLKDNVTGRDSPLVEGLREAGAIILGKTNLSQWANFRSNESISGWSAIGGQVRNPHILDRSPCGSSSGSGAAIAASLAAGAVGTETNGSIICPSNVNGIVGFKPTVGLVPQDFIVPISSSQDTAGPMTKTVRGTAMMLTAMARGGTGIDYAARLRNDSLNGARIGVMRFAQGSNDDVISHFDRALAELEAAGAILVEIDEFDLDDETFGDKSFDVLKYEFKATLNDYLANTAPAVKARSLGAVIEFNINNAERELALFDQDLFSASDEMGPLTDTAYLEARDAIQAATRENGIDLLLREHGVSVLVAPSGPVASHIDPVNGDVWPDWIGAGYLAAIAGYPHLTIPMGEVHGVPIGLSFMASAGADANLLSYGYAFEQRTLLRVEPRYLSSDDLRPDISAAMKRMD